MSGGSTFCKWDLHIHSPESHYNEYSFISPDEKEHYGENIWDKYIDELEKINDTPAIGITDYFHIDGYKKTLGYKNAGRLNNISLILPNIEFRLDTFVTKGDSQPRVNFHVIFSDDIDPNIIENEFLGELHIYTKQGEPRKLSKENIVQIGKELKSEHPNFDGSEYFVGCTNITLKEEEIQQILNDKASIFKNKYMFGISDPEWSEIAWDGQDHLTRKRFIFLSDFIFSGSPSTRDFALGKKHDDEISYIKEFGKKKPCIWGSDAHNFEGICAPDLNRFCWIKSDLTFSGLQQILYEPEERVFIGEHNPEPNKHIYTLKNIRFDGYGVNEELTIAPLDIQLNKSLVTVIGGKGTGKTALLDLIANCFERRCKGSRGENEDKNSFVQRIQEQAPDFKTEISFLGEAIPNFTKELIQEEYIEGIKITYLPQGKIEEYSGSRDKLNAKIQEIIFSTAEVISSGIIDKFNEIRESISELNRSLRQYSIDILALEEESTYTILSSLKEGKSLHQGNLQDIESKIQLIENTLEKGASEKIRELKERDTLITTRLDKLNILKEISITELKEQFQSLGIDLNSSITNINQQLTDLEIEPNLALITFAQWISQLDEVVVLVNEQVTKSQEDLVGITKEIGELSGLDKEHAELLIEKESITKKIDEIDKGIAEVGKKREEIIRFNHERFRKYIQLISQYIDWREYYEQAITLFSSGKNEILNGIDFQSVIYFDQDRYIAVGNEIFHGRKVTDEDLIDLARQFNAIINKRDKVEVTNEITAVINKELGFADSLKPTRNNGDLYTWIFNNYFDLNTQILFNNKQMEKLSMGQKGILLIKLFLAEGNYPLIIDQPEENLDNKSVFDELTVAYRQAKKNRQVIIATNNANLVVNADCEQVIVAEFNNNTIKYKDGTLEDPQIRNDITGILEGGERAFKDRERKYGFN